VIRTRRRSTTIFLCLATLMMIIVALTREFREDVHRELAAIEGQR